MINIISCLVFPFRSSINFSISTLQKGKKFASKANKDCQILLFEVHAVHGTPKVSKKSKKKKNKKKKITELIYKTKKKIQKND